VKAAPFDKRKVSEFTMFLSLKREAPPADTPAPKAKPPAAAEKKE
jgi:hypothetical protein